MEERNLYKIALIVGVIGILLILFVGNRISLDRGEIGKIDRSFLDKDVKVKGEVVSFIKTGETSIISIKDSTGSIKVVAFGDFKLGKGDLVEVEGKVKEYKGEIEIEANKITK